MHDKLAVITMDPLVKDAIGVQRFGMLFNAFKTIPAHMRQYALRQVIYYYHYCFAASPPQKLMDPLITIAETDPGFLNEMNLIKTMVTKHDPGIKRLEKYEYSSECGRRFTKDQVNTLLFYILEVQGNFTDYIPEIDQIFPRHVSYEDALRDTSKSILLTIGAVEEQTNFDIDLLHGSLKHPQERLHFFEKLIEIHLNRYICNKMLRMIGEGIIKNNRKAVAELYSFVCVVCMSSKFDEFPRKIITEIRKLPCSRLREFIEWKISAKIDQIRGTQCSTLMPEHSFAQKNMFTRLLSRIWMTLCPFLTEDELRSSPDSFIEHMMDFKKAVFPKPPSSDLMPQQARNLIMKEIKKRVPVLFETNPVFRDFSDLNDAQMEVLLKANLDRDIQEVNFVDFGGAKIFDLNVNRKAGKGAKYLRKRRLRKAKMGKSTKKETKQKMEKMNEKSQNPTNTVDENPDDVDAILEKDYGNDSKEAKEESEERSDLNPGNSSSEWEDDFEKVQEECRLIEEEQSRTIAQYRLLEKLKVDHAKLRRQKIHFQSESQISIEKPRVVAFFHTDDLRLIIPRANQVFIENQLNDISSLILNTGKPVKLNWIFNPAVEIDRHDYHFLCQLFGLSRGSNHLTFSNFLDTFRVLNPSKSKLTKKELSRSVFQFEHAFETDDQVFVPPIGGGHREHLSSAFNHDKIRNFMMSGGAHPYFFILNKTDC